MRTMFIAVGVPDEEWDALMAGDWKMVGSRVDGALGDIGYNTTSEPFRNGVILKIADAQQALDALEERTPSGVPLLGELDATEEAEGDEQAKTAIRSCLEVIGRHGG